MSMLFVGLGVKDILQVSKFFLKNVKNWKADETQLNFNLFGFVVSTACIPDYLFHDFYIRYFKPKHVTKNRFELLKMNDYINICKFRKECQRTGNRNALNFINVWESEEKGLKNDPNIKILFKLRNASIHHKLAIKPNNFTTRENIEFFGWSDKDESICIDDGVAFCQCCYDKMEKFINHVQNMVNGTL